MTKRTRKVSAPPVAVVDSQMIGPAVSWTPPIEGPVEFTSTTSGNALDVSITAKSIVIHKSGIILPSGEEQVTLTATGDANYPVATVTATVRARAGLVDLTLPELVFSIGQSINLPFGNVSVNTTLASDDLPSGWTIDNDTDSITGTCDESGTISFSVLETPDDTSIPPRTTHFEAVISNVTWGISAAAPSDIGGGLKRVVLTIAPQGLTVPATIDYVTGPSASSPIDPADIVGGYKSGTLTFTDDTPQTVNLDITAAAISAPSEVLLASIGSPSLGAIAVPSISVTVPALDAVVQRPTMSGLFQMESTITASFPGSTPEAVRWSATDWNDGEPDVNARTTISGATGNSLLLTSAQRNKAIYVERLDGGVWTVSNPSQFPVATFYGNPNPPATAQTMESAWGITGFQNSQSDLDKMKVLTDGKFGPSSTMTGRQSIPWAMLSKNHRFSCVLPAPGTGYYTRIMMRGTGLVSNNQAAHSYYSLTQQSTGLIVELRVDGATVGSMTISGSSQIGTDKAGRRWRVTFKDLPNGETRLYAELETGIGTGLYQASNGANGTLITTSSFGGTNAILTGTEVALSFPSNVTPVGTDDILIEDIIEPKLTVTDVQIGAPSGGNIEVTVTGGYTGTPAADTKLKLGIKAEGTGAVVSALGVHDSGTYTASDNVWTATRTYTQSLIEGIYHTGPTFTVEAEYADTSTYTVEYDYPYLLREYKDYVTPFPLGINLDQRYTGIYAKNLFCGGDWNDASNATLPGTLRDPAANFPNELNGNTTCSTKILTQRWMKDGVYRVYYPDIFTGSTKLAGGGVSAGTYGQTDVSKPGMKHVVLTLSGGAQNRTYTLQLAGDYAALDPADRLIEMLPETDANPTSLVHEDTLQDMITMGYTGPLRAMTPWDINAVGSNLDYLSSVDRGGKTGTLPYMEIDVLVDGANQANQDLWINLHLSFAPEYAEGLADYVVQNLNPGLRVGVEVTNEPWNGRFFQSDRLRMAGYLNGRHLSTTMAGAVPGQQACVYWPQYGSAPPWTQATVTPGGRVAVLTQPLNIGDRVMGNIDGYGVRLYEALVPMAVGAMFTGTGKDPATSLPVMRVEVNDTGLTNAAWREYSVRTRQALDIFAAKFDEHNVEWKGRLHAVVNTQQGSGALASSFGPIVIYDYADLWPYDPIDYTAPYYLGSTLDKNTIGSSPDGVRTVFTSTNTVVSTSQLDKITIGGVLSSPSNYTLSIDANNKLVATYASPPATGTMVMAFKHPRFLDLRFRADLTALEGKMNWPALREAQIQNEARKRGRKLYRGASGCYEWNHGDLDNQKVGLSASTAYLRDRRSGIALQYGLTLYAAAGATGPMVIFAHMGSFDKGGNTWMTQVYPGETASGTWINPAWVGIKAYHDAWEAGEPYFDIYSQLEPGERDFVFEILRTGPIDGTQDVDWAITGTGGSPVVSGDFTGGLPSGTVTFAPGEMRKTVTVPVINDGSAEGSKTGIINITPSAGAVGPLSASGAPFTLLDDD